MIQKEELAEMRRMAAITPDQHEVDRLKILLGQAVTLLTACRTAYSMPEYYSLDSAVAKFLDSVK